MATLAALFPVARAIGPRSRRAIASEYIFRVGPRGPVHRSTQELQLSGGDFEGLKGAIAGPVIELKAGANIMIRSHLEDPGALVRIEAMLRKRVRAVKYLLGHSVKNVSVRWG